MYANFYNDSKCVFSVPISGEKQGEDLADKIFAAEKVDDWTITEEPMSEELRF